MKWARVMTLVASTLPLSSASHAQTVIAPVTASLQTYVDKHELSGAVAMVIQDGKVVHFDAIGQADLATSRPMQKDTMFWVASQTKPMTAVCLLMLVEEGKVSLDDPVEKHLPEFKGLWQIADHSRDQMTLKKAKHPPTIRQVLTHTAGLADPSFPREGTPLAEAVATVARLPLNYEPGSEWRYCSAGSNTLGRIVEVVSGQPYETFLQQRLLDPLGMKDTTFWPTEEQAKRVATSYALDDGQLKPTQSSFINGPLTSRKRTVFPGGGLFSTADDIARFCQMLLNSGELDGHRYLKPETVKMMTSTQTGDLKTGFTEGMSFGFHLGVVKEPQGVTAMLSPGTFGHGGAFGTEMWVDPTKRLILLLMIQRSGLVPNGDGCDIRRDFQLAVDEALFPKK